MIEDRKAIESMNTVTRTLMKKLKSEKTPVTQSIGNTYENIINQHLLKAWTHNFKSIRIKILNYQTFHTVEFVPPKMERTFIKRFVEGKDTVDDLVRSKREIVIKISPRVFHTIKKEEDVYHFFKQAILYYDQKIGHAGQQLMSEVIKLDGKMKHLIANTNLRGLVEFPLTLLFRFSDVNMHQYKNTFKLEQKDIKALRQFIKNITSRYKAPEKERGQIVRDVRDLVKQLNECFLDNPACTYLPEAVDMLMKDGYKKESCSYEDSFINEQWDRTPSKDPQANYYLEFFGVKKLKKIPKDLVPYIQIETEAIETANDKMMLASYTLGKIEIVEWYLEILSVGSTKYQVPHTKPYLEAIRTQLLICYKNIMNVKIERNKPIIDIKYPKGYEG
jgi:hypothetical protein